MDDGELAAPALDVLVLLLEEGVLGVVAAGVEVGLGLMASDEAGVFALSVPAAAGLSDVSLPPGFILSE